MPIKITIALGTLLIAMSSCVQAQSAQTYLEGKIVSINNDGTAWMEVNSKYHDTFKTFTEHMFQDNIYRPYDVFRFQFHGTEIGLTDVDNLDPHAQTFTRAIVEMKSTLPNKPVKVLCLDLNTKKSMASCIAEVEGKDVSIDLLQNGFAQTHITQATPSDYGASLLKAENKAKELNIGIWSSTLGLFSKSL
jgi:hypothetical protein